MGFITAPVLIDQDGDGSVDGVLRRLREGDNIQLSLANSILTISTNAGGVNFSDGAPSSGAGSSGDLALDYTNGDLYRKTDATTWALMEQIPSLQRLRMFTARYDTSNWTSGRFGVNSGKYYFHHSLFPGCGNVSDAETYLNNLNLKPGTMLIFQQFDNKDNIAVWKVTDGTIYTNGDGGYDNATVGTNHIALVMSKVSGVNFGDQVYNVHISQPVNFAFDTSGNATIEAEMTVKEVVFTTAANSTSSTTIATIDEWAVNTYRSAKYKYQITNTGASPDEYHIGEMLVVHNGSTTKHNEYGVVFTGSNPLGTFSTDVSSGNCRLRFTPASSQAMTIKVAREGIKV